MKTRTNLIVLSLGLAMAAEAQSIEPAAEPNGSSPRSAVHIRIMELLKEDASRLPPPPKEAAAPFLSPDFSANDQPLEGDILELEPLVVTKKKPVELPLRLSKPTLENFFYGDGTIVESAGKRVSLSAGPERRGLAAIKLNLKF